MERIKNAKTFNELISRFEYDDEYKHNFYGDRTLFLKEFIKKSIEFFKQGENFYLYESELKFLSGIFHSARITESIYDDLEREYIKIRTK